MRDYVFILQGFLDALRNYSNHYFLFEAVEPGRMEIIQKSKLEEGTKKEVEDVFQIWLFNSTADFFYEHQDVNYTPILNQDHWKSLPNYPMQTRFIKRKIEQFFETFEIDLLVQKPYRIYKAPFGGHAVISDQFLLEAEGIFYVLSLGWDD